MFKESNMIKICNKKSIIKIMICSAIFTASPLQAGWFSDNWNSIQESIFGIRVTLQDQISEEIKANGYNESNIIEILKKNIDKVEALDFVNALIFLGTQNDTINEKAMFNLLKSMMDTKNLVTGDIISQMLYNTNMMSVVDNVLQGNQEERVRKTRDLFDVSIKRMIEISFTDEIKISTPKVSPLAINIFGNLGRINDNSDGLEKSWENFFRFSMSDIKTATAFFKILSGLDGTDKKEALLNFMVLGVDSFNQLHTSEGINFIIAVIEGISQLNPNNTEAISLLDNWMQIFTEFNIDGQIKTFTPIGERVMKILALRALECNALQEGNVLRGLTHNPVLSHTLISIDEADKLLLCGTEYIYLDKSGKSKSSRRIEKTTIINRINETQLNKFNLDINQFLYTDIDLDGVPDHLDLFPGFNDNAFIDENNNSIPDIFEKGYNGVVEVVNFDKDNDDILDFMDADINGNKNGEDNNSNGVIDSFDNDIYFDANGDLRDKDGDGIPDILDSEVYDDFLIDSDNDGIVDALDTNIYDDFNVTSITPVDTDGDFIPDSLDFNFIDDFDVNSLIPTDTDDDGIPDEIDTNIYDDFNYSSFIGIDTDNDGLPDIIDPDIDDDGIVNFRDADINGDGILDNGKDSDADGINNDNDFDVDGDGILDIFDFDFDNDGIYNTIDADVYGNGVVDEGSIDTNNNGIDDTYDTYDFDFSFDILSFLDSDNDGLADNNDSDIDGDGIENIEDADADADGEIDENKRDSDHDGVADKFDDDSDNDGIFDKADADSKFNSVKLDSDHDGIIDEFDVDVDGDGKFDNGTDSNHDGINDLKDERVEHLVYTYKEGSLFDKNNRTFDNIRFNANKITYVTLQLPENRSVVLDLPLTGFFTDSDHNILMTSNTFENGSIFMISMSPDGFGRAFMGNSQGGFEMSGNLQGLKVDEALVFSLIDINGKIAGKTRIRPNGKDITFSNSILGQ